MAFIDKSERGRLPKIGMYLFPVLTLVFVATYLFDKELYRNVIREDSLIEWLTFLALIIAGITSFIIALGIRRKHHYFHWFFILFSGFNLLGGLEEISWGQRVFQLETTGVFHEYSDQNEINLHNTFQGIFRIKTKHIALFILFIYGGVLPGLLRHKTSNVKVILPRQFIIPPIFLRVGFIIASILMLDFQTGHEEEIGEFFFSLCFVMMMFWNFTLFKRGHFRQDIYFSNPKKVPSLSE